MKLFIKLFFVILLLSIQACQLQNPTRVEDPVDLETNQSLIVPPNFDVDLAESNTNLNVKTEQVQLIDLFARSAKYHDFDNKKKQQLCEQFKQDYKQTSDWQTAWILVYGLNDNFKCMKLSESLTLLKTLQKSVEINSQLYWLNEQQIKLFADLLSSKRRIYSLSTKLKKENSKIEALKAIESDINDKLDGE